MRWCSSRCTRQTDTLSWILIVLAHWSNSPEVDMSLHTDTFFLFWASQSLLFLLNAASLAEKPQIPMIKSLVWPDRGSNPRSTALQASTLTITLPVRFQISLMFFIFMFNILFWFSKIYIYATLNMELFFVIYLFLKNFRGRYKCKKKHMQEHTTCIYSFMLYRQKKFKS